VADADQDRLFEQGRSAYQAGAFAKAREAWARILEDEPAHVEALTSYMNACYQMSDTQSPLAFFQRALEVAPDDEQIIVFYADALINNQEHQKAFDIADKALQTHPDNMNLRVQVGRGWMGFGESEKARKELWAAVDTDPSAVIPIHYLLRIGDKRDFERLKVLADEAWQRRDKNRGGLTMPCRLMRRRTISTRN
jgi:tetratricopeptide (TPR) repeat protein